MSGVLELMRRRGDEVALHPWVELAELGHGVLLALQENGELIRLLLEPVVGLVGASG